MLKLDAIKAFLDEAEMNTDEFCDAILKEVNKFIRIQGIKVPQFALDRVALRMKANLQLRAISARSMMCPNCLSTDIDHGDHNGYSAFCKECDMEFDYDRIVDEHPPMIKSDYDGRSDKI